MGANFIGPGRCLHDFLMTMISAGVYPLIQTMSDEYKEPLWGADPGQKSSILNLTLLHNSPQAPLKAAVEGSAVYGIIVTL
jgi:hypothetical protein